MPVLQARIDRLPFAVAAGLLALILSVMPAVAGVSEDAQEIAAKLVPKELLQPMFKAFFAPVMEEETAEQPPLSHSLRHFPGLTQRLYLSLLEEAEQSLSPATSKAFLDLILEEEQKSYFEERHMRLVRILIQECSPEELTDIAVFFRTDAGKKMITFATRLPQVLAETKEKSVHEIEELNELEKSIEELEASLEKFGESPEELENFFKESEKMEKAIAKREKVLMDGAFDSMFNPPKRVMDRFLELLQDFPPEEQAELEAFSRTDAGKKMAATLQKYAAESYSGLMRQYALARQQADLEGMPALRQSVIDRLQYEGKALFKNPETENEIMELLGR